MYSFPSASHMRAPAPRTMMGGSPPTDLNARAGESTPPGITRSARCCSARDLLRSKGKPSISHKVGALEPHPERSEGALQSQLRLGSAIRICHSERARVQRERVEESLFRQN